MTEGPVGYFREDADDLEPRPAGGRVFSLDGGGLAPAPGTEVLTQPPASSAVAASIPLDGNSSVGEASAPTPPAVLGWDDIAPDRLRESAAVHQARGVFGDAEVGAPMGMAWYELILGCLLGVAATLGMYEWSSGGLGPFVAVPSIVLGLILLAVPRHDVRHIGFGLLVSVPVAALLGIGLWYATVL